MHPEQMIAMITLCAVLVTFSIINWRARYAKGALGRIRQRSQPRKAEENQELAETSPIPQQARCMTKEKYEH